MKRVTTVILAWAAWLAASAMGGCGSEPPDPSMDRSRPSQFGFQKSTQASLVDEGRAAFEMYCVGCHGIQGDGRGEAAGFLDPRPRDFQAAEFKFNSRGIGELPTDDDLKRTIRNGLKGSAMPAFRLLQDRTLESLIAYVKTFSPRWEDEMSGQPITYVDDPWRMDEDKSEAIHRGEIVYHGYAGCWSCHPAYVPTEKIDEYLVVMNDEPRGAYREDIDTSIGKTNEEGNLLYPPDFKRDFVRSGMSLQDLYRSIGAGIQGSAMPKWLMSIEYQPDEDKPPLTTKADIWAMAYYIQDLIRQRPAKLDEGTFAVRNRPYVIYPGGLPEGGSAAAEPVEDDQPESDWGEEEDAGWPDEEATEGEGQDGGEVEGWGDEETTDGGEDDGAEIEGWGEEDEADSEETRPADENSDDADTSAGSSAEETK